LGTLWRLANEITGTVTNWTLALPRLPLSSVHAWSEARRLVLTEADGLALYLWQSEKNELRNLRSESYA